MAIEDALKEVVDSDLKEKNQLEEANQQGDLRVYLGSFDTLLQADEFKQFIKNRNDTLLENKNLKIYKKIDGLKDTFVVQLTNINSRKEGEKLCSKLSSRQFSCLLFNE